MSSRDLRVFLAEYNLKQTAFAKMIGVSRQSVSMWCNDKMSIPQRVIDFCKEYKNDTNNKKQY